MAGRSGPLATLGKILFALPFAGMGAFTTFIGARTLFTDGASGLFPLAFGLVFAGVGVWQIVKALRETRSVEELAARERPQALPVSDVLPLAPRPTGYRVSARGGPTAREVYAPVLDSAPLPKLAARPGRVFGASLGLAQKSMKVELVMAVLWNGLSWPMFLGAVATGAIFPSLFMLVFVAIGAWLALRVIGRFLGRRKLAVVEVDAEPAWLGDELRVYVEQSGPANIISYRVNVICREEAKYTVGTDTRTETSDVFDASLVEEFAIRLGFGERWTRQLAVALPATAPASFAASNNRVDWLVRVQAEIDGWPDYDELFQFRALPRLGP